MGVYYPFGFGTVSMAAHSHMDGFTNSQCALLADAHMHTVEGVRELLESAFDAVFVVANALSLEEGVHRMQPALAVLDLSVARGTLTDLVAGLKRSSPDTRLIALTVHESPSAAATVIAAGLQGVVLKRTIARDLLAAVDAVLRDETFVSRELGRVAAHPDPAEP